MSHYDVTVFSSLSLCPFPCVCLSVSLCVCPCLCRSLCLSLSLSLSLYRSLSLFLSMALSVSVSISLLESLFPSLTCNYDTTRGNTTRICVSDLQIQTRVRKERERVKVSHDYVITAYCVFQIASLISSSLFLLLLFFFTLHALSEFLMTRLRSLKWGTPKILVRITAPFAAKFLNKKNE